MADLKLERVGWKDEPDETTPIDSDNLKAMEDNTENFVNKKVSEVNTKVTQSAIGKIIYSSSSEITGNITLSETANNFDYLEIFYHLSTESDGKIYSSTKVCKKGNVQLSLCRSASDNSVQIYTKLVNVSGTQIKNVHSYFQTFQDGVFGANGSGIGLVIDKVIGYKL